MKRFKYGFFYNYRRKMTEIPPIAAFDSSSMKWKDWKEKFEAYIDTRKFNRSKFLSHLKHLGGAEIIYVLKHGRAIDERDEMTYEQALVILDDRFEAEENELIELDKFRSMKQTAGEKQRHTWSDYANKL